MTQDGPITAAQNSSHPSSAYVDRGTPDRVDTAVEAMKATVRNAVLDRSLPQSERNELGAGKDAMLPVGEQSGIDVGSSSTFCLYVKEKVDVGDTTAATRARVARGLATPCRLQYSARWLPI